MNLVDASRFPTIAFVETVFVDGYRTVGTATLIGPRLLLTAGHVVFDHLRPPTPTNPHGFLTQDGSPHSIRVTLGGSIAARFTVNAAGWRSSNDWVNSHSKAPVATRIRSAFDIGAIVLSEPVDNRVGGVFIAQTTPGSVLIGLPADVGGYSSKQFFDSSSRIPLKQMLISDARNLQLLAGITHRIVYSVNTVPGMSGGPVWTFDSASGNRTIRGIHTSFITGVGGSALRITNEAITLINQWLSETQPAGPS